MHGKGLITIDIKDYNYINALVDRSGSSLKLCLSLTGTFKSFSVMARNFSLWMAVQSFFVGQKDKISLSELHYFYYIYS